MVSKRTDATYAELRRRIMSGRYPPGEHLREEHIAEELGVSRTPVRAALERLVQDRLITVEGRAATVSRWTDWDIAEVFELRMLLEPQAAFLAASRATAAQLTEMDALNAEMATLARARSPARLERIQVINNRFHHLMLEAAGSGRLRAMAGAFIDTPMMIGSFYYYSREELAESALHHAQITDAIRIGDGAFARQAMAFHLQVSQMRFRKQRIASTGRKGEEPG